ncbi:hypothetical protein Bbelb_008290 [Branchiostoma belcheri]|nr:hypothetical protein Bbelb_008290 [Branchiostoma belcheri]
MDVEKIRIILQSTIAEDRPITLPAMSEHSPISERDGREDLQASHMGAQELSEIIRRVSYSINTAETLLEAVVTGVILTENPGPNLTEFHSDKEPWSPIGSSGNRNDSGELLEVYPDHKLSGRRPNQPLTVTDRSALSKETQKAPDSRRLSNAVYGRRPNQPQTVTD